MIQENISQEFRLEYIDESKNCCLYEIQQNELVSRKLKKVCTTLNCIEHFLILASTVTSCISISAFASLLGIPIGIMSSATWLNICAIETGIKKYKSIIKKNKKKHEKILFLAKSKLSSIKVLTSKTLTKSIISHDVFVLINNVLKEYDNRKGKSKF